MGGSPYDENRSAAGAETGPEEEPFPTDAGHPAADDEDFDWPWDQGADAAEDVRAAEIEVDDATLARDAKAAASFAGRAGARLLLRAETAVGRTAERFADRLEETAERLERLADDRLSGAGPRARAGEAAQSAARWIDDLAIYLRERDPQALREDLERQVRERPVQTVLMAAAAGWIVGRIMR